MNKKEKLIQKLKVQSKSFSYEDAKILPCLDNLLVLAKILDVQVENLIIQNQIK